MGKLKTGIVFNLLFWLIYFLYQWLGLAALSGEYNLYFINACMALPLSLIVSLITVHILVKNFFQKGRKLEFWILQILLSVALLLLRRLINYYFIYPELTPELSWMPLLSFGKLIVELFNLYLIVGVYAMFYFVGSWYQEQEKVQSLLREKTIAELELLKSQVQPHFIFNTLNNIYSVAMRSSPDTAKLIEHLSGLLSYNLYESKQDKVLLSSELSYIKHYLELQKNRYGSRLDVSINIYGAINDISIAPLLLLPLIENACKFGIADSVSECWIRIDISRQEDSFSIKIENSLENDTFNDNKDIIADSIPKHVGGSTTNGIGLENVQKRLQLIYPGAHEFKTRWETNSFFVSLKLKISNGTMHHYR